MFIPNVRCVIRYKRGNDLYGKPTFSAPVKALCGIVRLEDQSNPTSVRVDKSPSRGHGRDNIIMARILFPANTPVNEGDIIELLQFKMTVQSIWPRYAIAGQLDHWQADLTIFQA